MILLFFNPFSSLLDRFNDLNVSGTPADVACDAGPDILLGGIGFFVEQRLRGHDHTAGAITALNTIIFYKGLLQRVECPVR
jgi:hypothetical protein